MGNRILIVDDDRAIANAVALRLSADGFATEVVHTGPEAIDATKRIVPDLVVLDLGLPGMDGIEVCRRLREHRDLPIVMLTARDDETDVLIGLGVGADDYVIKPFSPRELSARITAVLRRSERRDHVDVLERPGLRVDVDRRRVDVDGDEVHLTTTEFDLLVDLLRADGGVRRRDQLLGSVWGYRDGGADRTVDSHVRSLRRKIGADRIRTVHGVGYSFDDGITDESSSGGGER